MLQGFTPAPRRIRRDRSAIACGHSGGRRRTASCRRCSERPLWSSANSRCRPFGDIHAVETTQESGRLSAHQADQSPSSSSAWSMLARDVAHESHAMLPPTLPRGRRHGSTRANFVSFCRVERIGEAQAAKVNGVPIRLPRRRRRHLLLADSHACRSECSFGI